MAGDGMPRLSPGAVLAWKIAAYEAEQLGSALIEPEHLFIGLLSLDKVLRRQEPGIPAPATAEIAREWESLDVLLGITGHDPVVLRRLMRGALGKRPPLPGRQIVHRSPACRDFFLLAGRDAGEKPVTANDLFSAVMGRPGPSIAGVLAEARQCVAAERGTDIPLPAGSRLEISEREPPGGLSAADGLAREIARCRESLASWPPGSREHLLTSRALCKKAGSLVRLAVEEGDAGRLRSALLQLAPYAGESEGECAAAAVALRDVQESCLPLPRDTGDRIIRLVARIEAMDGTATDRTR